MTENFQTWTHWLFPPQDDWQEGWQACKFKLETDLDFPLPEHRQPVAGCTEECNWAGKLEHIAAGAAGQQLPKFVK